jgi:hypothetical protein
LGGGDLTAVTVVSKSTAVFGVSLKCWSARHGRAGDRVTLVTLMTLVF